MLKLLCPPKTRPLSKPISPLRKDRTAWTTSDLAQVKAGLSYINHLDERREINVASLKRLKEARDALLGKQGEIADTIPGKPFRLVRNDG